jgi:DNA-directed RNA polymerase III subunit RPC1
LTPVRAFELFQKIPDDDVTLLWMGEEFSRPENLIVWSIPVPPVPIRPSVAMDIGGGSNEDDLTVKLQEIIDVNNALKLAISMGATMKMIVEDWEFLQIQVAQFVNGEVPGIPRMLAGPKPIRGLCQRLKGKQGRFRGNLSGKRVDFSGRTVISPDPNLRVEQLGVPELVAKVMTYPEMVNRYNIEKLRQCVLNGPDVHPGANMIRQSNGFIKSLHFGDRKKSAAFLKIGDVVERHMADDDVVLFNRQPSLHKMSIMSHRVKVFPWRTFRFNECACTPYNADFDGDEMNLHLPQTEEAKAEAATLMNITNNLITARNGEPLVAATQDFLTCAHLITKKDVFFSREDFFRVISYFSDALEEIDVPAPAIYKPKKLWTGKQVISILVRPNKSVKSCVNVESKERFYTDHKAMCSEDGYVLFYRGELMCGNLGKKTLGGESKHGLFYVLIRDYGPEEATRCMTRLSKLCARYMENRGFSIGISDVTPTKEVQAMKLRIMEEGKLKSEKQIDEYKNDRIKLKPGCNALQSLESELNGILGKIRERCGQEAVKVLHHTNSPQTMAQCGSKGSQLNISQMMACLGQQSVGGSRIQNGFVNRTLPHFPLSSLTPAAKGFVQNSFFTGLTATEFFFHTMGGREGLVDTAVKTAETGYMARRLMKALEDLSLQYDNTVRNSEQTVVQFSYGDDGLNPHMMEGGDRPVNYHRLSTNILANYKCEEERSLLSYEVRDIVKERIESESFQVLLPQGFLFLKETTKFFSDIADKLLKFEMLILNFENTNAEGEDNSNYSKDILLNKDFFTGLENTRQRLKDMSPQELHQWRQNASTSEECTELRLEYQEALYLLKENIIRITKTHIEVILKDSLNKYWKSNVEPGEAVGATGAQSLSEPGTQMTLKTFHFAGVASMNVTLGVPRLKEIINASKVISTPIITAQLVQNDNSTSARIVKARIEKTTLGEIAEYIREVHSPEQSYVSIKLDMQAIQNLHLDVNTHTVRQAILKGTGIGSYSKQFASLRAVKDKHVSIIETTQSSHDFAGKGDHEDETVSGCYLRIFPPESKDTGKGIPAHQRMYFNIQSLKAALPHIIVQGIPSVSRAVINEENDGSKSKSKSYYMLVEGYGLQEVMGTAGINGLDTKSNHVVEVQHVLGIEAARTMIGSEIGYIMSAYGITVDRRHLLLLSDVMTFKGEILGITRFGVAKMRESVLMLASFEKTTDHLFDAAVHSRQDSIVGVSECIIMGVPIPIGTGIFKLLHKVKSSTPVRKRQPLLDSLL